MKEYELREKLEKDLRWATIKFENYNSRVENEKNNLKVLQLRHQMIEEEQKSIILDLEKTKADFFDIMKARKESLKKSKNRRTPRKTVPTPTPPAPMSAPIIQPTSPKEAAIETTIRERRDAAQDFREVADHLNGETDEIEWLNTNHTDWIQEYAIAEGARAIWQGRITNGFRNWLESKNLKIGD